jgi:hypothetical protein
MSVPASAHARSHYRKALVLKETQMAQTLESRVVYRVATGVRIDNRLLATKSTATMSWRLPVSKLTFVRARD